MKVKIIDQPDPKRDPVTMRVLSVTNLDDLVNDFIKDKKVIDIKYQSNVSYAASDGVSDSDYERSVLIMYEEEE